MEPLIETTLGAQRPVPLPATLEFINPQGTGCESIADVAHEARNMVAALGLYCELLEAPGVLASPFEHYGSELKMVAAASRRLVDRLAAMDKGVLRETAGQKVRPDLAQSAKPETPCSKPRVKYWDHLPATLINNLAWELQANRNLLAALAGPNIAVIVAVAGGALPVWLNSEDFTRVLVNLVKNAVEALPDGGKIELSLRGASAGTADSEQESKLILNVEDNGPGVPQNFLDSIFEAGFTTRTMQGYNGASGHSSHRGLGLAITRSIIESAGGEIHAANRDPLGACFQIELPVRSA
jgi:signal transduction histidine kinase